MPQLAIIKQMSRQGSQGSAGDYQADEQAGVACMEFRKMVMIILHGFSGDSEVKASACNVGDLGSIPELGRSPGEGNGSPLQYSCLENPKDREA